MKTRYFLIFYLIIISISPSFSQSEKEVTYQNWFSFSLNKLFASSFLFYSNPEYYTQVAGPGSSWSSLAWTNGVEYYPSGTFDIFAYLYGSYTVQSSNNNTIEVRPVFGARWNIRNAEKKLAITLQTKYESRQFYSLSTSSWSSSHRFRNKLQFLFSTNRQNVVEEKNLILRLYLEEYTNTDTKIEERFWNTRSLAGGVYYRHNGKRRYELRYIYQGSKDTQEQEDFTTTSHILYFLVTFYL